MRLVERQDAKIEVLVQVLTSVSQAQLLQASAAQEVSEWGHVGHGMGVARIAISLANATGLAPRQVAALEQAAWVHDVGKVGLSRELWGGRRILPSARRRVVEAHVSIGAELAARANMAAPVQDLILHHHERWNGTGYPQRLAGEAIPLRARILAIAECVDAMLRPSYRREALQPADVVCRLKQDSGRLWDPLLVAAVCHSLAFLADEKWTCNLPATTVPASNIALGRVAAPKLSTCPAPGALAGQLASATAQCNEAVEVRGRERSAQGASGLLVLDRYRQALPAQP
jgi:putative nucleotidyltransferase with HDIG domain